MLYEKDGISKEVYFEKLTSIVNQLSQIGNVVMVGRGASIILGDSKEGSSSGILEPMSSESNNIIQPIKEDTNLSSLLNSNGSSGDTVILARQNIIYEA